MIRLAFVAALILFAVAAPARAACPTPAHAFDGIYCRMQWFRQADRRLNAEYARLRAGLTRKRRAALKADELAWIGHRDQVCSRPEEATFYVDLACAARTSDAQARFLARRFRDCVASRCSNLDFYNTPDGDQPDVGPTLTRYPAVSRYHGPDAGYIAVYTHDPRNVLYPIGNDMYVAGFIRLRGRYEGRIFRPEGYGSADISADPDFKKLTNALFPGHQGGTWAGGDTGGFVAPQ